MSVLVDKSTRVVVQGITGREGEFHARQMQAYGTQVVAGMTPGKGGMDVAGIPVFDTMDQAVRQTGASTSIVYVPARFAPDAIYEAVDAGIRLVVVITEGIPALDMVRVCAYVQDRGARLIGPNCPGVISPGKAKVGIMPGHIHAPGAVGLVSRSGTLTYEVVDALTKAGLGQSTCVGIGGDPVIGTNFLEVLPLFQSDPETQAIVLIGEIGGSDEERAARHVAEHVTKPVVAYIAGRTAPAGKRMGHAGAIIEGGAGTAAEKIAALQAVGVAVAEYPAQVAELIAQRLSPAKR